MKSIIKSKTTILLVILCILAALFSQIVVSPLVSNPETHQEIIQTLDQQKITVTKLTVVSATASAAVAAIPGDVSTPIANKIADLSGYLFIISCAILLEKFLLTVLGYISFSFIIPIAFLILAVTLVFKMDSLQVFCLKLIAFAIIISAIIPVSVKISNLITETHHANQLVEQALQLDDGSEQTEISTSKENNGGLISKIVSTVKETADSVKNTISNLRSTAEAILSTLFDAIAVLIITTCIIPILVFCSAIWMINLLFGLDIKIPKPPKVSSFKKKAATTAIE